MNLELVDHSISRPVGVAEDVYVKVGTFHFPADFVVVDFDADPRVPLILGRSFLKTERDLIDVFKGEPTLRISKEAITFNLDQTSRYSANYNDMTENQIDVIDMACEEYSQEVLDFSDVIKSSNPTPYYDPIVSTSSLTLTPLGDSDFLLREVDAFLALEDDATSLEVNQFYVDTEGDDKLPVIIVKDLSVDEKTTLITVLKSHKRAIAWKLSDIKGINLEFCTHKILMEEDFEPAVQHQRRVNPKIHDVIKNEVLKLLDAGLIYPIFDSPWVSPVHYVPKKGGFTVVKNEENELIPTHLVTGWRVCIDYQKMLKRCEDTNLCLNWEKSHFMVKEGIVLGHKISKNGIEVDKAKVDVIAKLPQPTTIKGVYTARKPLTFSRLATMDPPGDIKARTTLPRSDHETHFCNDQFAKVMLKYGVTHRLAIAYHPQTSGQVETTGDHKKVQLNELNELHDQAYENSFIYKEKTNRLHDSKIKDRVFNIDDRVLLFNSRLKIFLGKLKTHWSRPFTISHVFPYGTIELSQTDGPNFKVNGHRLKHYFREDIPKMVVPNLKTFPKVQ
uniref:DNA-directed DNA polymerase n=1 Tax=Tanacetum cinerariifolium TaxID=118510 RepID=A0A6L2NZI7_TANCI|nr:DNA-directed DNA polymerase [Tanacetum cinerariifolium]